MKKTRRKRNTVWTSVYGSAIDYTYHPGSLLAQYTQWIKPADGFASMGGPEPDVVNVGILARYPVPLNLEHEYYYKPEAHRPFWVSFGWSSDPSATIRAVKKPWVASWTTSEARPPREQKFPLMPDNIMAKNFPTEHRWKYNDIGDY